MAVPVAAVITTVLGAGFIAGLIRFIFAQVGLGFITYVGVEVLLSKVRLYVNEAFGSMGEAANILYMAGFDTALSLLVAGLSVRVALMSRKKFRVK